MISIILSSYNGENYIKEQIDSILSQHRHDWRLYVCDDGSSDTTCDIVSGFCKQYPNRIFLSRNRQNMGSTISFLTNVKRISREHPSDYYMFCDQDDVWLSDKLDISLRSMKKLEKKKRRKSPLLVFNDAILVDNELNYLNRSFYKTNKLNTRKHDLGRMLMENKCIGCTMMFNHSLAAMLDSFPKGIRYHDWWVALIASAFGNMKFIKVPTILYRQTGNNQVGQDSFDSYVKKRSGRGSDVKNRLNETYDQAEAFKEVYYDRLPRLKRRRLDSFLRIRESGFFRRRLIICKGRFYKSGFIRNIGLMFYV